MLFRNVKCIFLALLGIKNSYGNDNVYIQVICAVSFVADYN